MYQQYNNQPYTNQSYINTINQPQIQLLQTQTDYKSLAIKLLLVTGVAYVVYKLIWTPYSIQSKRAACIESCYAREEKKVSEEE